MVVVEWLKHEKQQNWMNFGVEKQSSFHVFNFRLQVIKFTYQNLGLD
ncbi:hypothetical protein MANES_12G107650v8 [Manihot esculenta]|uniref:Uncharacterized protein n=1 Tax=Manihot esculenta TaxID=3983 RepID=A0ACB7GQZ3_MANES|nr:hypothetical protein MANES_12G107650v8 [Manihot esculenta]